MPVVFGGPVADPWMEMKPPELETEVRTGGAWLLLPPLNNAMPVPVFAKMELDNRALPVALLPLNGPMLTPGPLFLAITFAAPGIVPPMVLLPPDIFIPPSAFPMAAAPVTSVP